MYKRFTAAGALSGAIAVALGAFAAHGLKDMLSENALRIFHTGVEYQFYHSLALLVTGLICSKNPSAPARAAGNLFLLGIVLFSGSLYCLSMTSSMQFMGFVTPLGGLCFIAGWLMLGYATWRTK